MSDTPETNKLLSDLLSELGTLGRHNCPELLVVHARKLERERDKWAKLCGQYKQKRDEAREAARRYLTELKNNGH